MRRTGIDLSPTRCIFVEAEAVSPPAGTNAAAVRVRRFETIDLTDPAALNVGIALVLSEGYPKHAWVNLWSLRSVHEYLLLPDTGEAHIRNVAKRHAAAVLGIAETETAFALTFGARRAESGRAPKREVSVYAAPRRELEWSLQRFTAAGFTIDGATTPCGALWSQARLLSGAADGVCAHVAIGAHHTAIGIFSAGALLHAKDLDWGYDGTVDASFEPSREELARRLATDLSHTFLYLKQYWEQDVTQVLLCGDMPDIRSLTAPLIEKLNIEVETLDTLAGLDTRSLPPGFSDQAAACRLALSMAAAPPPANLVSVSDPSPVRRRWILAGSTAAALAASAVLYANAEAARNAAVQEATELERQATAAATVPQVAAEPAPETPLAAQTRVAERVITLAASLPPPARTSALQLTADDDGWRVRLDVVGPEGEPVARTAIEDFLKRLSAAGGAGSPYDVSWSAGLNGARAEMTAHVKSVR